MYSWRRWLLAALMAVATVVGLALPASTQQGDHRAVPLPLSGYTAMAVDGVQGHVTSAAPSTTRSWSPT